MYSRQSFSITSTLNDFNVCSEDKAGQQPARLVADRPCLLREVNDESVNSIQRDMSPASTFLHGSFSTFKLCSDGMR